MEETVASPRCPLSFLAGFFIRRGKLALGLELTWHCREANEQKDVTMQYRQGSSASRSSNHTRTFFFFYFYLRQSFKASTCAGPLNVAHTHPPPSPVPAPPDALLLLLLARMALSVSVKRRKLEHKPDRQPGGVLRYAAQHNLLLRNLKTQKKKCTNICVQEVMA